MSRATGTTVVRYGSGIIMAIVLSSSVPSSAGTVLDSLLSGLPPPCQTVIADSGRNGLQIIYTRIDRDKQNRPWFIQDSFHVNPKRYFYPASLVKLPVAALALEKIAQLKIPGLTRRTPMTVDSSCGCPVFYDYDDDDPAGGSASIESSIKRMFLVSDNGGYNRLWEFLTRDYANRQLVRHGFKDIRLLHRLAPCTVEQNAINNPVQFHDGNGNVLYSQPCSNSLLTVENPCAPIEIGFATMLSGTLVPQPFKGDNLNYAAFADLHRFLIEIMFPLWVDKEKQLSLTTVDYRLLRTWMSLLPRESGIPRYASAKMYPDNLKKYLLYGTGSQPISPDLREYNIVGRAYGFISDVAYLADFKSKVEFFLSVVMYANEDGIINDDQYEYESVALPFFSALASAVYNYELSRPRTHKPDLSEFLPEFPGRN